MLHRATVAVLGQHEAGPAVAEGIEVAEGGEHFLVLMLTRPVQRRAQTVAGRRAGERAEIEVDRFDPLRRAEHQ